MSKRETAMDAERAGTTGSSAASESMVGRYLRSLSRGGRSMPDNGGGGGGSERSARSASKSRVSRLLQQQQQSETAEKRSTSVPPRRGEEEPNAAPQEPALPRRAGSLRGSVYKSDLVSAVGTKLEVGSNSP